MRSLGVLLGLLVAAPVAAQDHVLCNTTPAGPYTVTSGAPFTVTFVVPDTATDAGGTVPNRIDGFYAQIDSGPKDDVGKPPVLATCSSASQKPGDLVYQFKTDSGVSRGNHTLYLSSWNYKLDGAGNPTTNRQESPVTNVPFSAGDPILFGPPAPPTSIVITK